MEIIVSCIVEKDGKILMVREGKKGRNYGKWNFPIGHLEEHETICEGAIRETLEETGYHVRLTGMLPIVQTKNCHGNYLLIRFTAKILSSEGKIDDDILEVGWMKFSEILKLENSEFREFSSNRKVLDYLSHQEIYPLNLIGDCYLEE